MAKLNSMTVGEVRGKMGNMIVYQWNGMWVARQRPANFHDARTDQQMKVRSNFSIGVKLAASMREVLLESLLLPARAEKKTPYNLFMKLNKGRYGLGEEGEVVVDWPSLQLTVGSLPGVRLTQVEVSDEGWLTAEFESEVMTIDQLPDDADLEKWVPQGMLRPSRHDHVQLFAYSPSLSRGEVSTPVWRADGKVSLQLDADLMASDLHLYAFARDIDGNYSATTYGGELSASVVTKN